MNLRNIISAFLLFTLAACADSLPPPGHELNLAAIPLQADYVLVLKSQRALILYGNGRPIRQYLVALGKNDGPKVAQGDGRTPEGRYLIDYHKSDSRYYKALHISYPNTADTVRAQSIGYSPGGGIMIHGVEPALAPLYGHYDRTEGCIAVTNPEIEEIWSLVPDHTVIEIRA